MTTNQTAALKIKDSYFLDVTLLNQYSFKGIARIKNRTRKNAKKNINKYINKNKIVEA